ncbi:hypothetical protein ACX93W_01715 [Paenibacillus sp. CAU 1782]
MLLRKDPAEAVVVTECAWCRGTIYDGDEVSRIDDDGGFVHDGWDAKCAAEYASERVYDAKGTINARKEIE